MKKKDIYPQFQNPFFAVEKETNEFDNFTETEKNEIVEHFGNNKLNHENLSFSNNTENRNK